MANLRRKILLDIFATPGTLLPIAGGLTAWLAAWATDGSPTMIFGGLLGVLAGTGIMATRLILGLDGITQRAYNQLVEQQRQQQEQSLERLHARLMADNDPRTQTCLQELRHLYSRLMEKVEQGHVGAAAMSVIEGVDKIFHTCVKQLEESVDLWETAKTMQGPAKVDLLRQREILVTEVCDAVVHLGKTVDRFHAEKTRENRRELSRLRKELDAAIHVARVVDQRTDELIRPPDAVPYDSTVGREQTEPRE